MCNEVKLSATYLLNLLAALAMIALPYGRVSADDLLQSIMPGNGMPLWPVVNQSAKPIDDDLIASWKLFSRKCENSPNRYKPFPSKYKDNPKTTTLDITNISDNDVRCDSGDMTYFNGLLCAVGIEDGCS